MKTKCTLFIALLIILTLTPSLNPLQAQFIRQYGTSLNESFYKVIQHGSAYYVLGQAEANAGQQPRATVSRIDATGQLLWTRRLDIASQWSDAVLNPSSGNLFLVGNTLPFDDQSRSLMGVITASGTFSWVRSYNVSGRETFNRVVINPVPNNPAFPYYVLGVQNEPSSSPLWDDVVLLTVNETGNVGWKKIYSGPLFPVDDEFVRDMEALPNGDLLLAGNFGPFGVIFRADNTGSINNVVNMEGTQFSFSDVAQSGSEFIGAGYTFPNVSARLIKFDANLLPLWQVSIPNLTAIRQVWTANNSIYVTGSITVEGLNRGVVLKFQDGVAAPTLQWMKYLHLNETAFTGGTAWPLLQNKMAFVDGRMRPSGFGGNCAFLSVSDLEMSTCITQTETTTVISTNHTFNSRTPPWISLTNTPSGMNVANSTVSWQQAEACATCDADFVFQSSNCDTTVVFTNLSTVTGQHNSSWDFGFSSNGIPASSLAANPVFSFPAQCGSYNVCLTVTGNGCSDIICKTVNIKYPQTPVLTCPPDITLSSNNDTSPATSGMATVTDDCDPNPIITFSDMAPGVMPCILINRTWTVRYHCGDESTCVQLISIVAPPVYIPNAFSPNRDGINDEFQVFPAHGVIVSDFQLMVFDRWGNQLFQSNDINISWNGEFRGRQLDAGVYTWLLRATVFHCGQTYAIQEGGDVTLVR